MSSHALDVFDIELRVGRIDYDSRDEAFAFDYDSAWRERDESYSVSPHVLMHGQRAASGTVRRLLENLLPEGRALDIVASASRVSKNNIYGLIRALGQDTAGALSFLPADPPSSRNTTSQREISPAELSDRIRERDRIPFVMWDGRVRMSMAGYQDKLAVYVDQERYFLVEGELASTHILKPEPVEGSLTALVANEHFCMSLARRLDLAAAPVSILRLPEPVLVVERFDRVRERERVRRLHIVDACQALDFPVSYKYERNLGSGRDVRQIRDGVSFPRLFSLAEYTAEKAVTRLRLARWALFNYLIGNCDAHGKNVSFFCRHDGLWLAPCYDLVSVVQYAGLDHELAMAYGDEFLLQDIGPFAWADFARSTGIPRALLAREMRRMAKRALDAAPLQAADPAYAPEEKEIVGRINTFAREQANKLLAMAKPMAEVDKSAL